MTNFTWFIAILVCLGFLSHFVEASAYAGAPSKKESSSDEKDHSDHDENEGSKVEPEKGIIEANEKMGFKLSPEALKNFEIKATALTGDGPWKIPTYAIVRSGEEVNLFRVRDGYFKRIDFQTTTKGADQVTVDSDQLRAGDSIVTVGLGFLRIAELAAFGGVADSHSH